MVDRRGFILGAGALGISSLAGGSIASAAATPKKRSAHGPALDAIVLGAGISGLQTAWLLEQQGMKVAVLEGRQRVGGRVYTLMDEPGYPEMGFNAMAAGYGRGIDAAQRANVPLVDVAASYQTDAPMLWLNDKPMTREQWASFEGNPFPDALKTTLPSELVFKMINQHNRLSDWAAWTDPESKALDISLHEFLRQQGLSDEAIRLANDVSPYYGRNAYDVSALMLEFTEGWTNTQYGMGGQAYAVRGGNIQLPIAMAKLLKGDVLLGKEVIAIESGATEAVVHCRDGSRFTAGKVVSSMPFSALRHVKILPGLSGAQARAVASLPYQPLSMVFMTATAPFWEEDKLPAAMWTVDSVGTVIPQRFGSTIDEITGFLVQFRGDTAHYWDRMGPELAMQRVVAKIEEMRPAAKGKLRARRYFSWSGESFNGGDFSYFGPGDISGYINEMALPAGRLHFCGEHTATAARGLEAAMESAERVALELLV